MNTLSICMIVKNEEKHLARCLASVKDVADELVIVDTGSTDKTIAIAESFGAKVYHFDWVDDFSAARNYSLSKCTGDWILYLDADEELNKNSVDKLLNKINGEPAGIYCSINNLGTNFTNESIFKYPRLFVNSSGVKFIGKVHEQVLESLNKNKIPLIDSDIELIHHGYAIDEESLKIKKERNLALLFADENKQTNTYNKFKLIHTLISLERFDEAEIRINKLIRGKLISAKDLSLAMFFMAQIKFEKNDIVSALDFGLNAYNNLNDKPELNYMLYLIYSRLENFNDALKYILSSIRLNKNLLNRKSFFENENILDQIDLYLRAINLTLRLNDEVKCEKLIFDLSSYIAGDKHIDINIVHSVLRNLFLDNNIVVSDLDMLKNLFNPTHITIVVEIIKNCKDDILIISILNSMLKVFPDSSNIYKNLALKHVNLDKEKAIILFNKSLEYESDPSVYIQLISIYLSDNEFSKIKETFNILQANCSSKPQIKQKIDILKEKLNPFLKNIEAYHSS